MDRFLVVGTGRSGTRFTSELLKAAGINCGHENVYTLKVGNQGQVPRWGDYEADSSWIAVPYLHKVKIPSILVVRHPLATVQSMLELGWFGVNKRLSLSRIIYKFRPEIAHEPTRQDKALALWLNWNLAAESHARLVLPLEGMSGHSVNRILEVVGHPHVELGTDQAPRIRQDPERANLKPDYPREKVEVDWGDFRGPLAQAAKRVALNYGYYRDGAP